jgi:hypothetical protein
VRVRRSWALAATMIMIFASGTLASGCAFLSRGSEDDLFDAAAREGEWVRVEVQNQNFLDARIYALWGGTRQRIGLVTGLTTQTLQTEWRTGQLMIEVDFLAGGGFVLDPGPAWPGETLILRIPPN